MENYDATSYYPAAQCRGEGGVMFAPGVFVEGEPFSYGRLSERKLRRELRRRVQQLQDAYYTA